MVNGAGPWGTGPYKLVAGFFTSEKRSEQVVLAANTDYWDRSRFPRLQRIVFDNPSDSQDALELVKTREGRVDIVTNLSPLETLRVAQSPFAKVVKARNSLESVFGMFNMRKVASPWRDVRLRQAVNYAINRHDLIRYASKGNGVIVPALLAVKAFGFDPDLAPYAFDPAKARHLLREAGYPDSLSISLIAPGVLEVQATVVSKMLDQSGFTVDLQVLDAVTFNRRTVLKDLDQPPEDQRWDIALTSWSDLFNFPVFQVYHVLALDGILDWVVEQPALRQLLSQVLHTVDQERQQALIRQLERHTSEQAYFLFLYNPIQLYAVNKAVNFVPYVNVLTLAETSVTADHWSVRKPKATVFK
jgi:ABC-type transport system substrate-binding protein